MASLIEKCVRVELDIVHGALKKVGIDIPWPVVAGWKVSTRASVEQWAIRKRWSKLKRAPCPEGHSHVPGPTPFALKRWIGRGNMPN